MQQIAKIQIIFSLRYCFEIEITTELGNVPPVIMTSKRVSGRIAAKRTREAELADTEPVSSKINKIYGSKAQSKNWSASEKEKILEALRKYGTADIPKLQTAVPNRSQEAIKSFVEREKVKMTQVYREIILPDGRMKVK